jgi:putative peptidoglycan lipid II flippase
VPASPLHNAGLRQPEPDLAPQAGKDEVAVRGRGIALAATLVSLGNIASRVLGLVRDNRNAYFFGAQGSMSAFEAASLVPKNLYELLVGGMVSAALVPVFSEYASRRDSRELWQLVSAVLSLVVIVLGALVVLAEVAAPLLSRVLVGGFDHGLLDLTAQLIRIISPAVIFFGVSGVLTAVLYARQEFVYPAIGAAVFNLGGILGTQVLAKRIGISSLTMGIVLGAFLQMAVQLPGVRRASLRFSLDLRHPALRRIAVLYLPVLLSLVVSQAGIVIDRNLASRVGEEAIARMANATRLREFPLGLVSTAVSMAVLPALSRLDLHRERREFRRTLGLGLRLVLVLILPATVGLMVLGQPIITLLLQHGQFNIWDTEQTSRALLGYLIGTPFAAIDLLLIFAFYSQKDTVTPVVVGIVCVIVYLIAAPLLAFSAQLGMLGLVLANSMQLVAHAILMLILLVRRLGSMEGEHLASSMAKTLCASALMGILAALTLRVARTVWPGDGLAVQAATLGLSATVGVFSYAAAMARLKVREATLLLELLRRRAS